MKVDNCGTQIINHILLYLSTDVFPVVITLKLLNKDVYKPKPKTTDIPKTAKSVPRKSHKRNKKYQHDTTFESVYIKNK